MFNHINTLPSSSHELPMEPRAKVLLGPGKHSIYTHFPKGGRKLHGLLAENARAKLCLEQKNLVT